MCGVRKNTLVIDFSVLPVRPEAAKVQSFLEKEIKLNYADVKSIQFHNLRNCVLVEMKTSEIVSRYQREHNGKRKMHCAEKEFRIPVYVDCEAITVRVHDLPPSMSHSAVADAMLKYGEVISIMNEKWKHYFPGISNGVRVLRMNVLRNIPSFITVENERTMVTYLNQPKSCRHCEEPAHPGRKCLATVDPSTTQANIATSASSDGIFHQDDFPPINNKPQTAPSPSTNVPIVEDKSQQNDDEWTDVDDNTSNSTEDYSEVTHKRRRTKRNSDDVNNKKVCGEQCTPNAGHEETIIGNQPNENFFMTKNKIGRGVKCNIIVKK